MATEFKLPELGEGVEQGEVARVLVQVGDRVEAGQAVVEVESDKASVEVPVDAAGTVAELRVQAGDAVSVGQTLLTLESEGESGDASGAEAGDRSERGSSAAKEPASAAPAPAVEPHDLVVPELGEGIEEAQVSQVRVSAGERLRAGDPVVEVESDKATLEVPAEVGGVVEAVQVAPGDAVKVGQVIARVRPDSGSGAAAPPAQKAPARPGPEPSSKESIARASADGPQGTSAPEAPSRPAEATGRRPVAAAPSVRTLARSLGVDVRRVPGSGPAGRISKDDVRAYAESERPGAEARPEAVAAKAPVRTERLSQIRRTIAERMTTAWQTIPHVTLYREVDIKELEGWRRRFKGRAEARGGKLTLTALLVKICATALRQWPRANGRLDLENGQILLQEAVHVGVAVDTDRGLLVPVVRDAQNKSMIDLSVELSELSKRAREGQLGRADMQGATFSVSNLGSLGVGFFTPIINPPEVAILGVGRARAESDRLMLPLSLSIDHRMLDGADGARFLQSVAERLEDPAALVFEV
jgi:pyruvate dehydrogenase E2 component (dihydrolipoamide acetyltransferase)